MIESFSVIKQIIVFAIKNILETNQFIELIRIKIFFYQLCWTPNGNKLIINLYVFLFIGQEPETINT